MIDETYVGSGIYKENILDHYKNPRNYGSLGNADIKFKDLNPLCGDEIEITVTLNENKIKDIKFTGQGCAISLASASILTELIKGKTLDEVKKLTSKEILDNLGIHLSPIRIKCGLLALYTLKKGIYAKEGIKFNENE